MMDIRILGDAETRRTHFAPVLPGAVATIRPKGLSGTNQHGGTILHINSGTASIRVDRHFWDYETGWRFVGEWTDAPAGDLHDPDSILGNRVHWNRGPVYFSERDIAK